MDKKLADNILPYVQAVRLYHRHEVIGMENIPLNSPGIIVTNHSLATYDVLLLAAAIYAEKSIIVKPLIDQLFYKIPYLGEFMDFLGSTKGSPESARALVLKGNIICVAPGGMREALRPSKEKYQIKWDKRKGFAKIAMQTGAPIILAACPKADDMYTVYPSTITKLAYQSLRVPLFFARGLGPTVLPRPVKLIHVVAPLIYPPKAPKDPEDFAKELDKFHAEIVQAMKQLMKEAEKAKAKK